MPVVFFETASMRSIVECNSFAVSFNSFVFKIGSSQRGEWQRSASQHFAARRTLPCAANRNPALAFRRRDARSG